MSFAAWTKRSKLFKQNNRNYDVKELCQAAYKAGERAGFQQGAEEARMAIKLREITRREAMAKVNRENYK